MWLRGGPGDQGLGSLNFPGGGLLPWMQQRIDPTLLGNDHNQQYQAMLAANLQNLGGNGDLLRQQMMHLQQPFNYLQQSGNSNSLQLQQPHQAIQQLMSSNILQPQTQMLAENLSPHLLQKPHNSQEDQALPQQQQQQQQQPQNSYHDTIFFQGDQLPQRQHSHAPSPSYSKPDFFDSSIKFSSVSPGQNMLSSLCPEGSSNLFNLARSSQSMLTDQLAQQSWSPKYPPVQASASFGNSMSHSQYTEKNPTTVPSHCTSEAQNPTLFGVNIDSSGLLLPTTVPGFSTSSVGTDASTMPLGDSGFHAPLYNCVQDSAELIQSSGQVDPQNQTQTFVKV